MNIRVWSGVVESVVDSFEFCSIYLDFPKFVYEVFVSTSYKYFFNEEMSSTKTSLQ